MNHLDDDHPELPGHVLATLDRKAADASQVVRSSHASPPPFDPSRRLPPSALSVGLAAAMLLLVAGSALVLAASGRGGDPDPEPQRFAGPVDELAPLVPTYLPDGLVLREVDRHQLSVDAVDVTVTWSVFGLAAASDPYDGPTISLGSMAGTSESSERVGTQIDIVGVDAWIVDRFLAPMLFWSSNGLEHTLTGRWVSDDDLVAVAEALVDRPDADLGRLGWQQLGQSELALVDSWGVALYFGDHTQPSAAHLSLGWTAPGHGSLDLLRALQQVDSTCDARSLAACGGHVMMVGEWQAVSSPVGDGVSTGHRLMWLGPDGRTVWLQGWGIEEDELARVAEGLRLGTWDELEVRGAEAPSATTDTTMVPGGGPTGSPARDDQSARALVGDPRFQLRPIIESRGEHNAGWGSPISPVDAEALPPDAPATALGVTVDGWYPGAYDLGSVILDGTGLVDAYPLTSPANAFSVRGDRLWLRFDADAQALLAALADECIASTDICPTGRVAVVWGDEVIAIADLASGSVGSTLTIEVGSWGRSRWPE